MNWNIFFAFIMIIQSASAQDISKLKWEHRILISNDHQIINAQLENLKNDSTAFAERKLILLFVESKKAVQIWPPSKVSYTANSRLFDSEKEILLIGLDGAIKTRRKSAFDERDLFSIIDSMPMRSNEIRRKNE